MDCKSKSVLAISEEITEWTDLTLLVDALNEETGINTWHVGNTGNLYKVILKYRQTKY